METIKKKTDLMPIVEIEMENRIRSELRIFSSQCSWQVPILKLKVDGVYALESQILCPFHPVSMKAFFLPFNHLIEQYLKVSMSNGTHAKRSNTGTDGSKAYLNPIETRQTVMQVGILLPGWVWLILQQPTSSLQFPTASTLCGAAVMFELGKDQGTWYVDIMNVGWWRYEFPLNLEPGPNVEPLK